MNDNTYIVRSHLGHILKAGDSVFGYDLIHSMVEGSLREELSFDMQDVILVKKEKATAEAKMEKRKGKKSQKNSSTSTSRKLRGDGGAEELGNDDGASVVSTSVASADTVTSKLGSDWVYIDDDSDSDSDSDEGDDDNKNSFTSTS